MHAGTEPRWSRRGGDIVYYLRGNTLKQYDAGTGTSGVVHTFAEFGRVSGNGESDLCEDGDHMVLVGDGRHVFVAASTASTSEATTTSP
jgi:hypothetical protein